MYSYNPQKIEAKWPSSAKATEGKHSLYNPHKIEKKWQKIWEENKLYEAKDFDKREKFYCLDMFPYPSGEGLHVGHWRGYVLSDMMARYQMLKGKNVLHPMGWDAFGLPAENAAIKNKSHPKIFTQKAIEKFKIQLQQIGASFDWSRETNTSDPEYYKWTQWLFLKLYENGLAYRKNAPVNWCPGCQTVLANEQVVAGECDRCGTKVTKKELTQWFFKITDFAEDLLADLDKLDWPERTKTLQRNWIGKSTGAMVKFKIHNSKLDNFFIEVFTTRPDTLYGATFMVLSPENEIVQKITTPEHIGEVEKYIEKTRQESNIEREAINKEKTGVFTGAYAINPINNEKIPIWVSDYVLTGYGTGACMCVPAHDERDFEFAKKYNLPIKIVICPNYPAPICPILDKAYEGEGHLIDSGEFAGLKSKDAKEKIVEKLAKNNLAKKAINYRLRDWLISRQRYWGCPIPIVYCEEHGEVPVPEKDLPIELPDNVEFKPTGVSPLKSSKEFLETICPKCGKQAKRETDTMDTFVDSSWYYLRYLDPRNSKELASQDKIKYWMDAGLPSRSSKSEGGVDFYVGGVEHAILHLLYARFISKALHKLDIINFNETGEPFEKLFNIGMVYLHGAKMSKSKGNIVSPDELIAKYGSDALRGYELFIGPASQDCEWQIAGISGIYRFLQKVWLFYQNKFTNNDSKINEIEKTIKIVSGEIENLRPNTAISHLMELFNYLKNHKDISLDSAQKIAIIISPFFPHLAEELWSKLGNHDSIFKALWPEFDSNLVNEKKVIIAIQINGKTRDVIEVSPEIEQIEAEKTIRDLPRIQEMLKNKKIIKTIFITGRVLNFVVE